MPLKISLTYKVILQGYSDVITIFFTRKQDDTLGVCMIRTKFNMKGNNSALLLSHCLSHFVPAVN